MIAPLRALLRRIHPPQRVHPPQDEAPHDRRGVPPVDRMTRMELMALMMKRP